MKENTKNHVQSGKYENLGWVSRRSEEMQINLVELFLYKRNYKIVHNWFELAEIAHKEAILATATLHFAARGQEGNIDSETGIRHG